MNTQIYYFSGTGNSLYIAKELAKKTEGVLIPVSSVTGSESIRSEADAIGIVFPVYYNELPVIIKKFAQKIEVNGKYVFAVCNYGGAAGKSLIALKRIFDDRGVMLSAGFGVHMPQNAFHKPWEKKEKVYTQAAARIDFISTKVNLRSKGMYYTNIPLEIMMRLMHPVIRLACIKDFSKRTGISGDMPLDQLVYRLDSSFAAGEACTGCGTCERVCPVGNIRLEKGRPVWLGSCENCLACYNWCPSKAITGGVSKDYLYRNRDIKANEIATKS